MKLLILLVLLLVGCGSFEVSHEAQFKADLSPIQVSEGSSADSGDLLPYRVFNGSGVVSVASWNLQVFGASKAADEEFMGVVKSLLEGVYDAVFLLEVRDANLASDSSWNKFCNMFAQSGYSCYLSSRAGTTISKEAVGLVYKEPLTIVNITDYNLVPGYPGLFERPPLLVEFKANNYSLKFLVSHIKPDHAVGEIEELYKLAGTIPGNVVVMGDLNADCDYYSCSSNDNFDDWWWGIPNKGDTTVSDNNLCAYDRVIVNQDAFAESMGASVWRERITEEVSDHYLVLYAFIPEEKGVRSKGLVYC